MNERCRVAEHLILGMDFVQVDDSNFGLSLFGVCTAMLRFIRVPPENSLRLCGPGASPGSSL
jgi:hypothetical protein